MLSMFDDWVLTHILTAEVEFRMARRDTVVLDFREPKTRPDASEADLLPAQPQSAPEPQVEQPAQPIKIVPETTTESFDIPIKPAKAPKKED